MIVDQNRGIALAHPSLYPNQTYRDRIACCSGQCMEYASIGTCNGGYCNTEDLDHARSDSTASQHDSSDLIWLLDGPTVTISAYSHCFSSAADRTRHPRNRWNRHSRAAHRKPCPHHSIPNQILGEAGRANFDPQAAPTDSKAAERYRRARRTFSICFLTCQLFSNDPPVATNRQYEFSIQGAVLA